MEITVRPVGPKDVKSWRDLWRAYLAFYKTELPEEVYASTWRRLLGHSEYDVRGLLAHSQSGKAVGLAHYLFQRHSWRIENVVYLQDLYVDATARGYGVGRSLIKTVYAVADNAGCPQVYWTTESDNLAGRRLYDDVGVLTKFIKYRR